MTISAIDLPMEAIAQFCDHTNYREWAIAAAHTNLYNSILGGIENIVEFSSFLSPANSSKLSY